MEPRTISHVEIRTRDLPRAIAFYRALFDWAIEPRGETYATIDPGGGPHGAIMQIPHPDFPIRVCPFVLSEDCARDGREVEKLSGQVILPKREVPGAGWFVDTLDPWGNELAFWQPWAPAGGRGGLQTAPRPPSLRDAGKNGFVWLEVPTENFRRGLVYYGLVLGWRFGPVAGQPEYAISGDGGFARGLSMVGGERAKHIGGLTPYVGTDDLAQAAERVLGAGGTIPGGIVTLPDDGSFFVFADPEGNRLGVFDGK